jgi:hypothetical protein
MTMRGMVSVFAYRHCGVMAITVRRSARGAVMRVTSPCRFAMLLRCFALSGAIFFTVRFLVRFTVMLGSFSIRTMMAIGGSFRSRAGMMRVAKGSPWTTTMTFRRHIAGGRMMMVSLGARIRALSDFDTETRAAQRPVCREGREALFLIVGQ